MQSLQENVHTLTQAMTKEFLIMGQIMNQGVSRNPLHPDPPLQTIKFWFSNYLIIQL